MRINLNSVGFRYVLLLLVALVLADGLITEFVINSGIAWESNPLMRGLLPTGHFMLIKVAGSVLVALILADMYRHHPKLAANTAWLFVLVYTGIVYWNLSGVLLAAIIKG
jgi:hypothetical protein